jgi:hypothetical protein
MAEEAMGASSPFQHLSLPSHNMNVTYKFTGQKVVVTTSRSFDEVTASLDAAIQRVPKNRRNVNHADAGEGPSSGFM